MLEAVNTVLQTAPLARGNAEQVSTVDSFAANPARVQKVAQAPYVSPYIYMDVNYDKAILQIRDGETGDVVQTYPGDNALEARARDEARRAAAAQQAAASQPEPDTQAIQANSAPVSTEQAKPAQPAKQPLPKQIAAFVSAAQSGASQGAGVTVFA